MKRITYLLLAVFVSITIQAQPRITLDKEINTIGQIEWKKPIEVKYTVTNTGNAPLVLTNITTSCACAAIDWTKTPIKPGEKGTVSATFDAKQLGHFHKSIGVYSNAPTAPLTYIYFTGEVVRQVTDFSNLNLFSFDDILISVNEIEFPEVRHGENPEMKITVVNQSSRVYEPILMHLPSYCSATAEPKTLLKGEKGTITLTLHPRVLDMGLTQTSVYLSRFAGDKVSEENEIPLSVVLLPNTSDLTEAQLQNAPVIQLSEEEIDFSKEMAGKTKTTHTVTITNSGKSALEISKLQVFNPAVGVDLKSSIIAPGGKTKLKITLHKKHLDKKKRLRILLVTNDPSRSIVTINLKL
ncbi:DUF1573 domain-containing protein [Bacteroides sp. 214]|uniref:DUF1573 domain-containing protein n=1 Tax=Bacteroides sp. 214 TaxID=2302935 RepID=UPI0013D17361|nr:DUF1573 domain-containing protein [Bacteroides sp. 214]NDW13681.1 DUF1573 domain-containing protein [Bacteroides sp. 214]